MSKKQNQHRRNKGSGTEHPFRPARVGKRPQASTLTAVGADSVHKVLEALSPEFRKVFSDFIIVGYRPLSEVEKVARKQDEGIYLFTSGTDVTVSGSLALWASDKLTIDHEVVVDKR